MSDDARPRPSPLRTVALLLALAAVLWVLWTSRRVVSWMLVALILALALDPAVRRLQRHRVARRGVAVGVVVLAVAVAAALVAALVVPPLVAQVRQFGEALPGYVRDLTAGRGPLGTLETRFAVVERVRRAVQEIGASGVSSGAGVIVSAGRTVVEGVAATVTIGFMTLFMLLEGPTWTQRGYGLLPAATRTRWERVGRGIARTVAGYLVGNVLISVICGVSYGVVLFALGVPFPVALGFIVAVFDLVPLAGATIGGLIVVLAALVVSTTAAVLMLAFVVLYQLGENHVLQPLVYGRAVNLSPLVVLVAVLVGAQVAGVLGALCAIPVAGALQVVLADQLEHRAAGASTRSSSGRRVAVRRARPRSARPSGRAPAQAESTSARPDATLTP